MIQLINKTNKNLSIVNSKCSTIPARGSILIDESEYNNSVRQLERNNCVMIIKNIQTPATLLKVKDKDTPKAVKRTTAKRGRKKKTNDTESE